MLTYEQLRDRAGDAVLYPMSGLLFRWIPSDFDDPTEDVIMAGSGFFVRLKHPGSTWNADPFRSRLREGASAERTEWLRCLSMNEAAILNSQYTMELFAPNTELFPGRTLFGMQLTWRDLPSDHIFLWTYSGLIQIAGEGTGLTIACDTDMLFGRIQTGHFSRVRPGTATRITQVADPLRYAGVRCLSAGARERRGYT